MNCKATRELLFELTGDRMDRKLAQAAEKHLAVCPVCRKEYDAVLSYARKMEELKRVRAPAGFLERLDERIDRPEGFGVRLFSFLSRPVVKFPLATAALVALAFVVILVVRPDPEAGEGMVSTAPQAALEEESFPARESGLSAVPAAQKAKKEVREETIVLALLSPASREEAVLKTASQPASMKKSSALAENLAVTAPRGVEEAEKAAAADTAGATAVVETPLPDAVVRARTIARRYALGDVKELKEGDSVKVLVFRIEPGRIPALYGEMELQGLVKKPFPPVPAGSLPVRIEFRLP